MSVKQTLLDFRVSTDANDNWLKSVQEKLVKILQDFLAADEPVFNNSAVMLFFGKKGVQCTVRFFQDGLVAVDIVQYLNAISEDDAFKREDYIHLRNKINEALSCLKADFIPTINRGREILQYHDTSDERIKEYDFDRDVFHEQSPYQDVWIAHSQGYGNMLFLDLNEMLAESDINYTKALLGNGRENYKDKNILILGGGDGGVLHELLKESPKHVTMVEIDKVVVDASVKHLRGICGDSMDSYTGENYEIIFEDCVKILKECVEEERTFDFVINDLTDIPISVTLQDSQWEFVREILNLTLRVLTPKGKFYAQGTNGSTQKKAIEQYEKQLLNLCYPVEFRREFVYVPSFQEDWTFYEVWRKRGAEN